MTSNIVLGSGTQQNLLALQNLNTQLQTTQNALATGLSVSSAVDDAVKYFESQSLDDRANDLSTRKDAIDQGVSSVTTATQGIQSANHHSAAAARHRGLGEDADRSAARLGVDAVNTLSAQLNQLLDDSSYQGLNLINSSTSNLSLQFTRARPRP